MAKKPAKQEPCQDENIEPGSQSLTNIRHERFCHELLIDGNATRAYKAAGFSPGPPGSNGPCASAWKLQQRPEVQARFAYLERQRLAEVKVTREDVIKLLLREANHVGKDSTASARVRAAELLGKSVGVFEDRVTLGGRIVLDFGLDPEED